MIRLSLEDGKFVTIAMVPAPDADGKVTMRAQLQICTLDGNRVNVKEAGLMQKDELAKLSRLVNGVGKNLEQVGAILNPIVSPPPKNTDDPV